MKNPMRGCMHPVIGLCALPSAEARRNPAGPSRRSRICQFKAIVCHLMLQFLQQQLMNNNLDVRVCMIHCFMNGSYGPFWRSRQTGYHPNLCVKQESNIPTKSIMEVIPMECFHAEPQHLFHHNQSSQRLMKLDLVALFCINII